MGGLTPGIPKTQEVPKLVKFAALRCVKAIEQAEALFGIQLQLGVFVGFLSGFLIVNAIALTLILSQQFSKNASAPLPDRMVGVDWPPIATIDPKP